MKSKQFMLALVTAPNLKVARQLARSALKARLIACANLVPQLESHYWWQGKMESGKEVLMLMKTTRSNAGALEKWIIAQHPYDTPEFLLLPITGGNARYLKWLADSVADQ